jgi:hypothetical protein
VLLFDEVKGSVEAWAPSGPDHAMVEHLASVFHATVPLRGICREVLHHNDPITAPR